MQSSRAAVLARRVRQKLLDHHVVLDEMENISFGQS